MERRLGRYELGRRLGSGGQGEVFEAVLHGPGGLHKPVALKLLHDGGAGLRREARIGGLLRHENLVDVYEVGEHEGTWFCAMELCRGGTLQERIPLPPRAVVDVGRMVCAALVYAHEELGLVHLDLKPTNLLLDGATVKVADLGFARAHGLGEELGRVTGTPGYMPPEQLRGLRVDARADVFALGRTLLELATGALGAADTVDLDDARPDEPVASRPTPAWLERVVARCVEPDPRDRYASMVELDEALAALDVDGPGLAEALGRTAAEAEAVDMSPTTIVGRQGELATLIGELGRPGVVTLKGPAGIGKTHLARAARARIELPSWWCALSGARERTDILRALAVALDVRVGPEDEGGLALRLGGTLRSRGPCLVILDGFDPVVAHADLLGGWRAAAPAVRFLATSREPLGLDGEDVVPIGPLSLADGVTLIRERAVARGVELRPDLPELAELAARLDGVPLALELAAGRLGILSVREVADRLSLSFLRGGRSGADSLAAALDWSWELLEDAEQDAVADLSVFRGSFEAAAAEAVLGGAALDVLGALLERSWLVAEGERFRMLEPVRAYAAARLPDATAPEARHAAWFARFGREDFVRRMMRRGASERLRRLEADVENLLAAARSAIGSGSERAAATAIAAWQVLSVRGPVRLGARLLADAAERAPPRDPAERIRLSRTLVRALRASYQLDAAVAAAEALVALCRSHGHPGGEFAGLLNLGVVFQEQGRPDEARAHHDQALAVFPRIARQADATNSVGTIHLNRGALVEAARTYEAALALARADGEVVIEQVVLGNLGQVCRQQGRTEEARGWLRQGVELALAHGDRGGEAALLVRLASVERLVGRPERAAALLERALVGFRWVGDRRGEVIVLGNLANAYADLGRLEEVTAWLVEAVTGCAELGDVRNEARYRGNLADHLRRAGRLAEAFAHAEAALAIGIRTASPDIEGFARGRGAEVLEAAGRGEEAQRWLLAGVRSCDAAGEVLVGARLRAQLARSEWAAGRAEAARALLDETEAALREHDDRVDLLRLLVTRARVMVALGEQEAAETALEEAERLVVSIPDQAADVEEARAAVAVGRRAGS